MLRQKTLLGETYVELTPGRPGRAAAARGRDAARRAGLRRGPARRDLPGLRRADAGRVPDLDGRRRASPSAVAASTSTPRSATSTRSPSAADDLLRILDSQRLAVKKLARDGGATFDAISKQPDQLRSLIQNTESVFSTTAARDSEIRQIFQVLPTFLDESKLTLERLDTFAADTNPLVTQLRPVGPRSSAARSSR